MVVHTLQIDSLAYFGGIVKNHRIVVVEASSTPDEGSNLVSREVNDLSEKYRMAYFVKLNKNQHPIITADFRTSKWPTLYIYKDQIEVHEVTDMNTKKLDALIAITLRSITPAFLEAARGSVMSAATTKPGGPVFRDINYTPP
ncbi:hypothetical protein K3495_g8408 [Podosphaera aphanis]|nr:hypothetical protein K3495_g8408 [Podosphaera aphanis]